MNDVPAHAFYTGLVAELYSTLRSTSFPADRYARLIRRYGEPALELGCGDGDPLLALRELGLDLDGIDSSTDMIDRLRTRAAEAGIAVNAWVSTMQDLAPARAYRTVFLAGPTFNLLPDDQSMAATLRSIRGALAPGGTAVIPLFVPEAYDDADLGVRVESADGAMAWQVVSATRDEAARTQILRLRYERQTGAKTEMVERDWLMHWVTPRRFADLAEAASLVVDALPDEFGSDERDVALRRESVGAVSAASQPLCPPGRRPSVPGASLWPRRGIDPAPSRPHRPL
ncbi:class I SAM-dependent methyltransferase [Flexivirga sp. ID2601S]|uniref:Class I SAM-dependent methyltransferase n=1 Tax=Flexivirga aerilata TaxID=1656889 RepID=A0A849ALI9_9MICO|nr:class I SAM-dependent methyltransferase [Flexivirga aerilata]